MIIALTTVLGQCPKRSHAYKKKTLSAFAEPALGA
jgi:hypothetical protein